MATAKKTTTKKDSATEPKKTTRTKKTEVVELETSETKTTKRGPKAKKYVYVFFNCNDEKDAATMNIRYNNEAFDDSEAGRKALWKKIEAEVKAGKVNLSDKKTVQEDILNGNPTDASEKLQYGVIERLVFHS